MGIIEHVEGNASKRMSRCFGAGNDKDLDFMLQTTDGLFRIWELVGMIYFVADGWIGLEIIRGFAVCDDAFGQVSAMLHNGKQGISPENEN